MLTFCCEGLCWDAGLTALITNYCCRFLAGAIEKQKLVYILNRDAAARLTISSPLEAHKANTLVYHVVGVDVGFENPMFACLEMDYEVRRLWWLFAVCCALLLLFCPASPVCGEGTRERCVPFLSEMTFICLELTCVLVLPLELEGLFCFGDS